MSLASLTYAQDFQLNNVELRALDTKLESLKLEKKIINSSFLPELNLNGGIGSEKLKDNEYQTDKGPYAYISGKLNLYRGGKDTLGLEKIEGQVSSAILEREIKKRELKIELVKKLSAIEVIDQKNALISEELKQNKIQQSMARKKVDAGLTSSVDLLDFEQKDSLLLNLLEKNNIEKEEIQREVENSNSGVKIEVVIPKSVELDKNLNYHETPAIQLANEKIHQGNLVTKEARADFLPIVDLESKWGQITPQEKFLNKEKEHQLALNITIPLFSGLSTSSKLQQATIESTQIQREARQDELVYSAKLDIGKRKIEILARTLATLEKVLAQSIKYKELTVSEYKRGVKNSPDVISASDKKFELSQSLLDKKNELFVVIYSLNETFRPFHGESK